MGHISAGNLKTRCRYQNHPRRPAGSNGFRDWLSTHSQYCMIPLIAMLLFAVVYGVWHSSLSFFNFTATTSSAIGWSQDYLGEINLVQSVQSPSWSSMPSSPSWVVCNSDPVIDWQTVRHAESVGMDLDTRHDGIFKSRNEVFDPPLGWTHRLIVYNRVNSGYHFLTDGSNMHSAQGTGDADARIYRADVEVMLRPGETVAVPSPTPDAVVTSATTSPRVTGQFTKDASDALYFTSSHDGIVRLRYTLSTWQNYSFAALPDVPFQPVPTTLPDNVRADAQVVINAIGGLPAPTYAETVRRLHAYCAGFTVGPIDQSKRERSMFLTMALQRRGVCRHRARSFFIIASGLGIQTRLVENRRHSFCEVRLPDGSWRRLEFRLDASEGPPSGDSTPAYRAEVSDSSFALPYIVIGLVGLLMLVLLGSRRHNDIAGHIVTASRPSDLSNQRARRDMRSHAPGAATASLIELVRTRLIEELELNPVPPYGLPAACRRRHIPDQMIQRARHIMEADLNALEQGAELSIIDEYFWDCLRIMYYLQRMVKTNESTDRH